jgi:hypothetical protein
MEMFFKPSHIRIFSGFTRTRFYSLVQKQCPGCGAQFQKIKNDKPGFLPEIRKTYTLAELEPLTSTTNNLTPSQAKLLANAMNPKVIICKRSFLIY